MDNALSPREIQARIRGGDTVAAISEPILTEPGASCATTSRPVRRTESSSGT